MTTLHVHFNGQPTPVPAGTHLAQLLAQLAPNLPETSYASAVNAVFVPRHQRAQHRLQHGDTITTFQAIVGG